MTWLGDGNVGINDSSPTYKLDVNGTFRVTGASVLGTISSDFDPTTNSTYDLGENTNRWANIFADTFYGAGSNITALNASALSSGTVPTARLGTGTADSSTFLRGDNTWVANASGTVTSVTAGTGMTQSGTSTVNPTLNVIGGTGITANANDIAITNTAVSAGSYTYASITVDAQGRLTAASSGTAPGGGTVTGTGTANYISKWTGTSSQGNSLIFDNGTNVGIGTNAPLGKLDIYESSTAVPLNTALRVGAYANDVGEGPFIDFVERWGGSYPNWIVGRINETDSPGSNRGALVFYTNESNSAGSGAAGTTEKMRIQGDGNVGIGTNAPGEALDIVFSEGVQADLHTIGPLRLENTGDATGIQCGIAFVVNNASSDRAWAGIYSEQDNTDDSKMNFWTETANSRTVKVTIANDGYVGIGTASPVGLLDVYSTGSDPVLIRSTSTSRATLSIRSGSGGDAQVRFQNSAASKWTIGNDGGDSNKFKIAVGSGAFVASEAVIVDTSGNLSILGTLTEASSLTIKENIETYSPSLEMISKIRPVRFNKKKSRKKEVGLVAEELAEMFPELVETGREGQSIRCKL